MKKYIVIIIAISLGTILIQGCRKSHPDEPTYYVKFSSNALEYVHLTAGKYLIYKDSATSILDSVTVTKSNLETVYQPTHVAGTTGSVPACNCEKITLTLTKYSSNPHEEWFSASDETFLNSFPYASTDMQSINFRAPDYRLYFSCDHSTQSTLTMTVEGRTFDNVMRNYGFCLYQY